MTDLWTVLILAFNGLVFGVVIGQLVKFRNQGGKLSAAWDDRPVSRRLLAVVALAGLILLTRLVALDLDTRTCIEQTRANLVELRIGQIPDEPLTESCGSRG